MTAERHVFAGNNTADGFFSYFDNIIDPVEAKRIYILKGGPGVGKSSLMKKFAKEMSSRGYFTEYIHCSSDENSLDGVLLPELKTAIVDGTAPHTLDPSVPGAVDQIINLGSYLNNSEVEKHKSQIIQINKNKSQIYKSAYRYIQSAHLISKEINSIYDKFTDETKFYKLCEKTLNKIFLSNWQNSSVGKVRKMFADAYTAGGYVNYADTLCQDYDIWAVIGGNINYSSKLLEIISTEAVKKGFYTECYYRPLDPKSLQHVIIPKLNIILMSTENHLSHKYDEVINLHETMDSEKLKKYISEIEANLHLFDAIMSHAFKKLSETKKQHELLELFYVNNMDFSGVDLCLEKILSQHL